MKVTTEGVSMKSFRMVTGSNPRSESEVQSAIRLRLGQLPDVRVWRNNVGQLSQRGAEGRKTTVRFGLCVGSSDLLCIVGPRGRWLAIEVKAEGWKPAGPPKPGQKAGKDWQHEEDQRNWIAIVEKFGGVGGFATNEDEAMALVERARTE